MNDDKFPPKEKPILAVDAEIIDLVKGVLLVMKGSKGECKVLELHREQLGPLYDALTDALKKPNR